MDKIEEALSKLLKQESDKISNPIICHITNNKCERCQPLCTHRRKEEVKRTEPHDESEEKKLLLDTVRILHQQSRDLSNNIEKISKRIKEIEDMEVFSIDGV